MYGHEKDDLAEIVSAESNLGHPFPITKAPDLSIGRFAFLDLLAAATSAYFSRTSFFVSEKLCCVPVAVILQK